MTLGTIINGANISNTVKLDPMEELSHYFPTAPMPERLILVIQVPPPGEPQPFTPANATDICISL